MDFTTLSDFEGNIKNPYAGKTTDGKWIEGTINDEFLNTHFGEYTAATEMKEATTSEGLQLFFDDLVAQDKLDA